VFSIPPIKLIFLVVSVWLLGSLGIIIFMYETNDWWDFRMLAPVLWLTALCLFMSDRRIAPLCILAGSLLLSLPISAVGGKSIGWFDALFTSTSAVCVTGLVVRDTGTTFTRFGQTVSKGLKMLERKLESIRACDFVFLEFGGNDSDYDWKAIAAAPDASYSPKTVLSEFVAIYKKLIATVREAGLTPIVLNLPPIEHNMYFDRVRHGCNGDNILKWLKGDKTEISRWHGSYSDEIKNICRESEVRMIDIRSAFEGRDLTQLVCPDGIHPNEKGHELIYEKILTEFC